MKKFIIFYFCLFCCLCIAQSNSYLQISGKSNVNSFKCINNSIYQKSAITLPKNFTEKIESNNSINLIVKDFTCENKMMTSEFRKTLNAEKFPFFYLKIVSFSKKSLNQYTGIVEVKMMNKTKTYTVDFTENEDHIIGKKTVRFSDFGINPPQKMGGLLVVRDNLDLLFSLPYKEQ